MNISKYKTDIPNRAIAIGTQIDINLKMGV